MRAVGSRRFGPALLMTALVAVLAAPLPAAAAALAEKGWWWRAQTGLGPSVPPPPQVPEGGLYVEGAPDGPNAIAALRFVLAPGELPEALTLRVAAEQGGDQAVLLVCPAGGSWIRADAGRWENRPVAACEGAGAPGVRAADGTTWRFDLGLVEPHEGRLDLVLTPGTVEGRPQGADGSVFSLAVEVPGGVVLETRSAPPAEPPPTPEPVIPPPVDVGPPPFAPPPADRVLPPPPDTAAPQLQDPSVISPKRTAAQPVPAGPPGGGKDARALAALVALLSVGIAGVLSRDGGVPLPLATLGAEGAPREGGIGRFRRIRQTPPPPL